MNKRTVEMIDILVQKECTLPELAEKFSVSLRTIRNDIAEINVLLEQNGLSKLKFSSGEVVVRPADFSTIATFIPKEDFYTYKLSKEERIQVASTLLICAPSYIMLATIAENLVVSRRTVINDLDDLKVFLSHNTLQLLSHPNKGLRVQGEESFKRKLLLKLASATYGESNTIVAKYISVQGGQQITISKIITEQEHQHKSFLTDDSFQA